MRINFKLLALFLIVPLLLLAACEEAESGDGAVTVKVTGITVNIGGVPDQNIVAAVFPENSDPGSDVALAGQRTDCTAAGDYTLILYKMATPTTIGSEIWEGEGGERYDLWIYIDGNANDVPDDAGIDWNLKIWPITFEIDGDYSITVAYPADFIVAD